MKVFAVICFCACVGSIFFINDGYSDCGIIKYKIDATRYGKYEAHADPILVINFHKNGIHEIHPSWNIYMSSNVGDNICFIFEEDYAKIAFCIMLFSGLFLLFSIIWILLDTLNLIK